MTAAEMENLFAATLKGDYDDDVPWAAVRELRTNGSQAIFEKAAAWCQSPDPRYRERGADILCQLRAPMTPGQKSQKTFADPIYVAESFSILSQMIAKESDERALSSELYGLGHLGYEGSSSILAPYATHASSEVRCAAAHALGSLSDDPKAVGALTQLADDPDDEIRDWSLFALGSQSNADSHEIREVFVRHLEDTFPDAREEAIAGLAKRKDPRAALPLLRLMQSGSYFSHHEYDFKSLFDAPDDADWGIDDYIDALYARFPDLLPPREKPLAST
jgi:HEAT repeat protein